MVKKLIIMIIDALRWDFITGSIGKVAMPITSSLIANSSACLLQTKVQPPTVTMPRIKVLYFKQNHLKYLYSETIKYNEIIIFI